MRTAVIVAVLLGVAANKPADVPPKWRDYIGEYDRLIVLEKGGQLYLLENKANYSGLTEASADRFRSAGHDDPVDFRRDAKGKITSLIMGDRSYSRKSLPERGELSFRIKPQRPVAELMKEALLAEPPKPRGEWTRSELVDLAALEPTLKVDIRYATANNFLGEPVYPTARALLQKPAAEALVRVHRILKSEGLGLLIHDAYRPWHVTKVFWEATPAPLRKFVADPSVGSRHNRGCAVDLTLFDLKSGSAAEMPGGYDEFSERSYPNYPGGTSLQRWYRDRLRSAMESEGFAVFEAEWWHFDFRDWKKYAVQNEPLEKAER